jgi:hypothetical protein
MVATMGEIPVGVAVEMLVHMQQADAAGVAHNPAEPQEDNSAVEMLGD